MSRENFFGYNMEVDNGAKLRYLHILNKQKDIDTAKRVINETDNDYADGMLSQEEMNALLSGMPLNEDISKQDVNDLLSHISDEDNEDLDRMVEERLKKAARAMKGD